MKGRFGVFLLCATIVFGQTRAANPQPAPPRLAAFDLVVSGADGLPVSGLSSADFELTQAGQPQNIDTLTWFDTKRHSATGGAAGLQELSPGDIRRNIILIVDDLGLTPARAIALQDLLRTFVLQQMTADDYATILRVSSGAGWQQALCNDKRGLIGQSEWILPVGHGLGTNATASAIWQTIRWAAEGLREIPGRKSVVLVSEHLDAPLAPGLDPELTRTTMGVVAHAATTVFYTVDPRGPGGPPQNSSLAWLIRETGGLAAPNLDAVLRDQEGYYVLGFRPAQEATASIPAVLKLRSKVHNLRWRFGFISRTEPGNRLAPHDRATAVQRALNGAGNGADLRVGVTPLFAGFTRAGAAVDVLVFIDARDLSVLRDSRDTRHVALEIQLAAYGTSGRATAPPGQGYTIVNTGADYAKLREGGLVYGARITLPDPGGYQIRAAVIDGLSDRVGSAMQFVEIPANNRETLAVSGLVVKGETSARALNEAVALDRAMAAIRVFKAGAPIAFSYGVFNASLGPAQESRLRLATHIYATGREVYQGKPVDLEFPATAGAVRQVNGRVQLDERLSPGEYAIEVEVTDLLAREGPPRVATQWVTFEVRE